MMIKRFITVILCAVMIFGTVLSIISCGNSNSENNNFTDNNAVGTENAPEEITKNSAYEYGGEHIDFNGESFNIIYPSMPMYLNYYFADEKIGEAVNDALYRRLIDTEEFFNIEIQYRMIGEIHAIPEAVRREVMSGTNSIDIALTHCIAGLDTMVIGNLVYNWAEMPNVDFRKRYWNSTMNESLTINGYMPFAANDFILPEPNFLTFSKDLLKEYMLEDPYSFVKSGKWTWDKLIEMARQVSKDLDGNGIFDENDLYGFVGELSWQFISIMYSCDQRLMKRDTDGRYVFDLNTGKAQTILEKLDDLLYTGNQTFTFEFEAEYYGKPFLAFDSGRALFYMNGPSYVKELRATEFDFGILPYPKLDENQENYITLNWAGTIAAPANIANPEKVGAVVEFFGAISHEIVRPAYFDILLNGKLARDEESREMLDIIYGDSLYDFGLNFSNFNDLLYIMPNLLAARSTDLASYYERRATNIQRHYDRVYDAFIENS